MSPAVLPAERCPFRIRSRDLRSTCDSCRRAEQHSNDYRNFRHRSYKKRFLHFYDHRSHVIARTSEGPVCSAASGRRREAEPTRDGESFTADGSGRITEASVDLNDDLQVFNAQGPVQGTYTVDTSLNDAIRGQINIPSFTFPNYPSSPTSPALQFVFVLASDGKSGTSRSATRDSPLPAASFTSRTQPRLRQTLWPEVSRSVSPRPSTATLPPIATAGHGRAILAWYLR